MQLPGALALALALVGLALAPRPAQAAEARHVLVLLDEDKELPGLALILRGLREGFGLPGAGAVELYTESMNLSQFGSAGYEDVLRDHYRRKYAQRRLDLVVAVMQPALEFLLRQRASAFPGVPIVFCGLDASAFSGQAPPDGVTGVVVKRVFAPTLEIALRLQPEVRQVFVVSGASGFDRSLEAMARRDLRGFEGRVAITWLAGLPMDDLLSRLQALPAHSVILYTTMFADGAGRSFVPHEALSRMTSVANAPVYVFMDQYLDRGTVGGYLYTVDQHGRLAAAMGLRILNGEAPSAIPIVDAAPHRAIFDWRQLRRWGLDEARLPAGSEIRFRPPSAWSLYKVHILAGAVLLVLQSAFIASLLGSRAQRKRALMAAQESEAARRRAESAAAVQRDELAHALRVSTLGEMTASFAHEINQPLSAIMTNAQGARRLRPRRQPAPDELDDVLVDIAADAKRASETIRRLQTLFRKQRVERAVVDVNTLITDIVALLRGDIASKHMTVRCDLGDGLPPVMADPIQLQQVVLNLVVNAFEAMAGNGEWARELRIETREPVPGRISLAVHDQGSGTGEAELERMFEHFVSSKPLGLGMGLAISRTIVQAHGGRIWATRNPDRGLTLHVDLPAAEVAAGGAPAGRVARGPGAAGTNVQ